MSAESELELKIAALDHEQFERMVFDLVLDENPGANRLKPPDAGADTLVLGSPDEPTRVWQAKHYTRAIKWGECEESLQHAIERYGPESVTFVFAKDLTEGQLKGFETRLLPIGAEVGVEVAYWGLSALRARLQRNTHIRVRHLQHDQQVLLDIAAGRASADPIMQALNLEEAFGAEDPAFEFEVELLRRQLPEPEISAGEAVTLMLKDGPRTLRVGIRRRDDEGGPAAVWGFADDERGEAARQAALLATARGDHEVTIDSGFVVQLQDAAPKVMKETMVRTPPEHREGRFVFQPGPGIPLASNARLPSGEVSSREVTMYPFPPAYWELIGEHHRAYVGLDGALMAFIAFKFADPEGTHGQIRFLPMLQLGASARENVEAVRFCLDLHGAEKIEFSGPLFPPELIRPGPQPMVIPNDWIVKLNAMESIYEGVVSLEEHLGMSLPVHAPPLTGEEIQELGNCLAIISDRQVPIIFSEASGEAPAELAGAEMQRVRNHPAVRLPRDRQGVWHRGHARPCPRHAPGCPRGRDPQADDHPEPDGQDQGVRDRPRGGDRLPSARR